MSSEKVVYEAPLRGNDVLRGVVSEYKGKVYVHLRVYYEPKGGGALQPGKGLAVRAEQLPLVISAVKAIRAEVAPATVPAREQGGTPA